MLKQFIHNFIVRATPPQFSDLKKNWKNELKNQPFRFLLLITILLLSLIAFILPYFFAFIEARKGFVLNDVILNLIPALNMSAFIFGLIYVVVLYSIFYMSSSPVLILKLMISYVLLLGMRLITLYFVALDPDKLLVPLNDPFINRFFYPESFITKDLFFSGHVSTLFLLFLIIPDKIIKSVFLATTVLIAVLLLIQHVHYTIDILAAPFFSWLSYRSAGAIMNKVVKIQLNKN